MAVYVLTGVSRGIGFELVKQISAGSANIVIGLVRDKSATEEKISRELGGRSNIHILYGDLNDHASLERAALATADIVGDRGVDYLVANGAAMPYFDAFDPISVIADQAQELDRVANHLYATNVTGNIHFIHLFLHLVLKGKVKKVIALSSGHADLDFINDNGIENSALYAASKAALNVIVAKFQAQYKKDGVLFISMSPGVVDVGKGSDVSPEQMQKLMGFVGKVQAYAPYWKGPTTTEEAIPLLRSTWERASLETGYAGAFISQFGNKQWV